MITNLTALRSQVTDLQRKIEEIKVRDRNKVLSEIRSSMEAYDITLGDLQKAGRKPRNKKSESVAMPKTLANKKRSLPRPPIKFLGPNGSTWTGRGVMPKWLREAIASGRSKEEFSVSPRNAQGDDPQA